MGDSDTSSGDGWSGARGRAERPGTRHPRITRRWLESALLANRAAFEDEMARRRRSLDREFDRFWRARQSA